MASDYQAIRDKNKIRYGTEIERIGKLLLANRYDDRTHFIYELLQNAEDALAKRDVWTGQRSICFDLAERELRVSHFGKPFDEADVCGICGIADSYKDEDVTQIGYFGIGFKSVYAYTDRPEIHSGVEDFGIESFVWPIAVAEIQRENDETIIVMPLREPADAGEIGAGLKRLGANALLFLREIEEIEWNLQDGLSGLYLRQSEDVDNCVRRITVLGEADGQPDTEQTWLVFSKAMHKFENKLVGHVEIAFFFEDGRVRPISRSPLVVFFPTVVETNLGFCVQGPYRTTPSRDNVPHRDDWNRDCVQATATLLVDALKWLRDNRLLDVNVLQCLPLERKKFDEDSMFAPFYAATKRALGSQCLLPRFQGGYLSADTAKLARTQEIRELFDSDQLARLFNVSGGLAWLSDDISENRTPLLRHYLMNDLKFVEVTPEMILQKFDAVFLEEQSDQWVCNLYEFLNGQPALRRQIANLPLVRLANGRHVQAHKNGRPQAFLAGEIETNFPTVREAVCNSGNARAFLRSLGLTKPDPVDDVIQNILCKYENGNDIEDDEYDNDIYRILNAYRTDSRDQRDKLLSVLRRTPFIKAIDARDDSVCFDCPENLYIATDRLKKLFDGIPGIKLVDDDCIALRGEEMRTLLEACGATRHLKRQNVECQLSFDKLENMRREAGLERYTQFHLVDFTLRGIDLLLNKLTDMNIESQRVRSYLLWEALIDLVSWNQNAFQGLYSWSFSREQKKVPFDAEFVRHLNGMKWIPDKNGKLQRPNLVLFESLDWPSHPFLLSKICFKPPVIDQLAQEAGFEPAMLDMLKNLGITSESELIVRLGLPDTKNLQSESDEPTTPAEAVDAILGDVPRAKPSIDDLGGALPVFLDSTDDGHEGASKGSGSSRGNGASRTGHERSFNSYVTVHHDDNETDPDGLEQAARMDLEEKAVDFILSRYPNWERTSTHNPGFDLFESGPDGNPVRWCEVKAMTGSLDDRPVGLSRTQFECACKHGANYWLYVVEYAGNDNAQIIRIQNPAGKARTFTFDRGWRTAAEREHKAD